MSGSGMRGTSSPLFGFEQAVGIDLSVERRPERLPGGLGRLARVVSRVESVCTDLPAKGPTGPFCLVHLQMLPCPHGVVPVAEVEDAGRAVALAQALEAGGLRELHQAPTRLNLAVLDRVGGGNSFASGLVYAFLSGLSPAEAVAWGAAHGALAIATPGDASMATRDEVDRVLHGSTGRVAR